VLIPIMAAPKNGLSAGAGGAQVGTIFNPPQLLWWFGSHSFLAREARPLIVLVAVACASLWWTQRARHRGSSGSLPDALRLLALVMLLRAALDPWNNLYYHVPFLFALMAYEIRAKRMPLLAVGYSFVLLAVVPIRGVPHMSLNLRAAVYAATILPTIVWLAAMLYLPNGWSERISIARRRLFPQRVTTDEVAPA
jgi:hypothetical protein